MSAAPMHWLSGSLRSVWATGEVDQSAAALGQDSVDFQTLSALATGASWLCCLRALEIGDDLEGRTGDQVPPGAGGAARLRLPRRAPGGARVARNCAGGVRGAAGGQAAGTLPTPQAGSPKSSHHLTAGSALQQPFTPIDTGAKPLKANGAAAGITAARDAQRCRDHTLANTRLALVPPKPKLFDITALSLASRVSRRIGISRAPSSSSSMLAEPAMKPSLSISRL